jgi:hypothetical protein
MVKVIATPNIISRIINYLGPYGVIMDVIEAIKDIVITLNYITFEPALPYIPSILVLMPKLLTVG